MRKELICAVLDLMRYDAVAALDYCIEEGEHIIADYQQKHECEPLPEPEQKPLRVKIIQ